MLATRVPARQDVEAPVAGDTELIVSEQTVDVRETADDDVIARRLREILAVTGRIADLSVRVESGVVFLAGRTRDAEHKAWAREVVLRTQDVVAVVNDLEVEESPLWDLSPARREMRALWREAVQSLPLLAIGLAVLIGTLLVARGATRLLAGLLVRRTENRILRAAAEKVILVMVLVAGLYVFLRVSGLTRVAATLIGGTGLIGLVLGLAFRDIAENFLASLLISVQQPFRLGDTIEIEGHTGVVQRVTPRGTILMDFDGNYIQIANATIYKSTIKNFTANPRLRIDFAIGVGYETDVAVAQDVAMGVMAAHSAVLADPPPMVLVEHLGSATIDLRVYAWIDGHAHSKIRVRSSLMRLVVRAFEDAGISLPDEAREVVFPDAVPVRMLETAAEDAPERPGERAPAPSSERAPASRAQPAEASTSEGALESEVEDLQEQARTSRSPEEGAALLEEQGESSG